MLKEPSSVKEFERYAADKLEDLLREIPALNSERIVTDSEGPDTGIDFTIQAEIAGHPYLLVCEVKRNGQPRYVRESIYRLRDYISRLKKAAIPLLIAPYLSPAARELCRDQGVSFLDFEGNARIAFGTIFIDRLISNKPTSERREFKSLFTPKSARVLRVLLRDPRHTWRVIELAQEAGVSLGHVSNVRTALLDREWARVQTEGLQLTSPNELLDAWKVAYEPSYLQQFRFYTTLHGSALEKSLRSMFASLPDADTVAMGSLSAAHWIAPYARAATQYLYANKSALESLKTLLHLVSAAKGGNVLVTIPKDDGVFMDAYEPAPGVRCTSPLQTYLDLTRSGERGEEAAEHLRRERLTWQT
jgi:hypothetical protein